MTDESVTPEKEVPKVNQINLDFNGQLYTLQHPGARAYIRKYQTMLATDPKDMESFLDWAFEEIVHPDKGAKLTLDTVPLKDWDEWFGVLVPFLSRGELDRDYAWTGIEGTEFFIGKPEETEDRAKRIRRKRGA